MGLHVNSSHNMTSIVLNRSPSGFRLSRLAISKITEGLQGHSGHSSKLASLGNTISVAPGVEVERDHPLLVAVVKELGPLANGPEAELEIVTIPDGVSWSVCDLCGIEFISADGKAWPATAT